MPLEPIVSMTLLCEMTNTAIGTIMTKTVPAAETPARVTPAEEICEIA